MPSVRFHTPLSVLRRRKKRQKFVISDDEPEDEFPAAVSSEDGASVDSGSATASSRRHYRQWNTAYEPQPIVDRISIWVAGAFLFLLAMVWPPLILLFAYLASKLVPYSFRENDEACARRRLYRQFSQSEHMPEIYRQAPVKFNLEERFWPNERGMLLMTSVMTPRKGDIKAVVCFCHGYTDNCSFSKRMECQRLVKAGIAFVTIEYEGHGRSDGPLGLISDWDELIDDVTQYFQHVVVDDKRFRNLPVFLMGESMGGAVSYSVYNRIPHVFRGVIFVCPMCKISDDMLPPGYVIDFLKWIIGPTGTTSLLGYLPIAPSRNNLSDVTHRVPEKAAMLSRCPTVFGRNPRLATARELIRVTQRISNNLSDFDAPFLVLHGKADRVTDPDLSQALYDESKSTDKSIQLYDGMWHSLTGGEPDENVDRVFNDIIAWIEERS